jgi:hypothetical protein
MKYRDGRAIPARSSGFCCSDNPRCRASAEQRLSPQATVRQQIAQPSAIWRGFTWTGKKYRSGIFALSDFRTENRIPRFQKMLQTAAGRPNAGIWSSPGSRPGDVRDPALNSRTAGGVPGRAHLKRLCAAGEAPTRRRPPAAARPRPSAWLPGPRRFPDPPSSSTAGPCRARRSPRASP